MGSAAAVDEAEKGDHAHDLGLYRGRDQQSLARALALVLYHALGLGLARAADAAATAAEVSVVDGVMAMVTVVVAAGASNRTSYVQA